MTVTHKIVLSNLVVFGALLSGLAMVVYHRTARSETAEIDSRLGSSAAKIITEFEDEWEEDPLPEWDQIMGIQADGLPTLYMLVRDVDGHVIFAHDSASAPTPDALASAESGKSVHETVSVNGRRLRQAAYPIAPDEEVAFTLTVSTPLAESDARLSRLALMLMVSVAVVLLLASAATHLVTRWAFTPMSRMVRAAEEISALRLDRRIEQSTSRDEVARLASALNNMMDRIEAAFKSQRQFVADASHELRTPLTVIMGELEYIQKRLDHEGNKENVRTALEELGRLSRLVEQLLVLARIDAGKLTLDLTTVRLDEVLLDCVRFVQEEARRKELDMRVDVEAAVELQADPVKLKSIILNLLENAVRYTQNGGSVSAVLRHASGGKAELTVADTGPGIRAEDRPRVFDRFYRAAGARTGGDGSGLGLAIARELVDLHRGHISLDDAGPRGASFTVELPVLQPGSTSS